MGKEDEDEGMAANDLYVVAEEPRHVGGMTDNASPFQRGDPLRVSSRRYKKQPPGRIASAGEATSASISSVGEESPINEWEEDVEEEYYETNCNIMQKLDELRKSMEDLTASHDDTFDKLVELDVPEADIASASRVESPTLTNIMRKYSNYEMDRDDERVVEAMSTTESGRKLSEGHSDETEASRKTSESYLDTTESSRRISEGHRKNSTSVRKSSEGFHKSSASSRRESFADRAEEIRRKYSQPENDYTDQGTTLESTESSVNDIVRKYSQPEKKEVKAEQHFDELVRKYSTAENEYTSTNSAFTTSSADASTEATSAPLSTTATSMKLAEVPSSGEQNPVGAKSGGATSRLQKLLTKYSNEEDEYAASDEQVAERVRRQSSTTETNRRLSSVTGYDEKRERRKSSLTGHASTLPSNNQRERRKSSVTGSLSVETTEELRNRRKSSLTASSSENACGEQRERRESSLTSYASANTSDDNKERRRSSVSAYSSNTLEEKTEVKESSLTSYSSTSTAEYAADVSRSSTSADSAVESQESIDDKATSTTVVSGEGSSGGEESSSMSLTEILRKYSTPDIGQTDTDLKTESPVTATPANDSCYQSDISTTVTETNRRSSQSKAAELSVDSTIEDEEESAQNLTKLLRKYSNIDGGTTPSATTPTEESSTTELKEGGGSLQRSRRGSRCSRRNSRNSRRNSRNSRRSSMTEYTFEKAAISAEPQEVSAAPAEEQKESTPPQDAEDLVNTYTRKYSIPEAEYGMTDTAEKVVQTSEITAVSATESTEVTVRRSGEESTSRTGSRRSSAAEEAGASQRLQNLLRKYSNVEDQYQETEKVKVEETSTETTQYSSVSLERSSKSENVAQVAASESTSESTTVCESSSTSPAESSSSSLNEILRRYSSAENTYEETGKLEEKVSSHPITSAKRSRRSSRYSCEARRESSIEKSSLETDSSTCVESVATTHSSSRKSSTDFGERRERRKSSSGASALTSESGLRRSSVAASTFSSEVTTDFTSERSSDDKPSMMAEELVKSDEEEEESRHFKQLLRKYSGVDATTSLETKTTQQMETECKDTTVMHTETEAPLTLPTPPAPQEESADEKLSQILRKYSTPESTYTETGCPKEEVSSHVSHEIQSSIETTTRKSSAGVRDTRRPSFIAMDEEDSRNDFSYESSSRRSSKAAEEELRSSSRRSSRAAEEEIKSSSRRSSRAVEEEPRSSSRRSSRVTEEEPRSPSRRSSRTVEEELRTSSRRSSRAAEEELKPSSRRSSKVEEELKNELKEKLKDELKDKLNEDSSTHRFNESKLADPSEITTTTTSSTTSSPVRVVNFVSTNTISRRYSNVEEDDYYDREIMKSSSLSQKDQMLSHDKPTTASNDTGSAYGESTSAYSDSNVDYNQSIDVKNHEESKSTYSDSLKSAYQESEYEGSKSVYDSASSTHNESMTLYDESNSSYNDSATLPPKESTPTYQFDSTHHESATPYKSSIDTHEESTTSYKSSLDTHEESKVAASSSTSNLESSSWSSKSTQSLYASPSPSSYNSTSAYMSNTLSSRRYSSLSAQDLTRDISTEYRPPSVRASAELFREDPVFQRSKTQYAPHITVGSPRWSPASSRRSSIASTTYESNCSYLRKATRLSHSEISGGYSSSHKASSFTEESHCPLNQPLPSAKKCGNWPNCSTLSGGEPLCCTNYVTNNLLVRKLTSLQEKTKTVKLDLEESFKTIDNLNTYVSNLEEKRRRLRTSITDFEQKLRY